MDDQNTNAQAEFKPVPNAAATPAAKVARRMRTQTTVAKVDPLTETVKTTDIVSEVDLYGVPDTATLAAPYAYYDDDGVLRSWAAGQVLIDTDEIAMLLDRGALFIPE